MKDELNQLFDDEHNLPQKRINRENWKLTFRHIIEAKLYYYDWTVNDNFFYDYLHQSLLNRWGLN